MLWFIGRFGPGSLRASPKYFPSRLGDWVNPGKLPARCFTYVDIAVGAGKFAMGAEAASSSVL